MKKLLEKIVDRYRQWREYAGPRKFEESVITVRGSFGEAQPLKVSDYIHRFLIEHNSTNPTEEQILEHIKAEGKSKGARNFVIDSSLPQWGVTLNLSDEVGPQKIFSGPEHFAKLEITSPQDIVVIDGAHIIDLQIKIPVKDHVIISNCCINDIYFPRGTDDRDREGRLPSVEIINSWIGRLHLNPQAVHDFTSYNSWICSVNCPPPDNTNPFVGSVKFHKVKMPTSKRSRVFRQTGTQQFRNLRAHFEKLQNGPMAGQMRAKELASEREETEWGITKLFNWVYFIASGYGQKPGKAFIWCLFFLAISISNLTLTDGVWVDPDAKRASQYHWVVGDPNEKVANAFILTFQTAVNPFTIFFTKAPYRFKSYEELFQTLIYVLIADGAFLFGVFAIRKRLKF